MPIPMGILMSMGITFSRTQKFLVRLKSRGIYVSRHGAMGMRIPVSIDTGAECCSRAGLPSSVCCRLGLSTRVGEFGLGPAPWRRRDSAEEARASVDGAVRAAATRRRCLVRIALLPTTRQSIPGPKLPSEPVPSERVTVTMPIHPLKLVGMRRDHQARQQNVAR